MGVGSGCFFVIPARKRARSSAPAHNEPPFAFLGSAPVSGAGPSGKMAVTGAAIELAVMHRVDNGHGIVSEPFHEGRPGR
jgi:hypothetical protein